MPSDRRIYISLLAASVVSTLSVSLFAQSTAPLWAPSPAPSPATAPATIPAPVWAPAPVVVPVAPPAAPASVSSFVGVITADRVYVRSGPAATFYEIGQLNKGDLVNITGTSQDWYEITPPAGTYALVAKELVDADAAGTTGTVKPDTLNVRAGSVLSPKSEYAVIGKIHKGTKVTIVGSTDKYYKITQPAGTVLYVKSAYVKAAPGGTVYEPSTIAMPGTKLAGGAASTRPAVTNPGVVILPPGQMVEEPGTPATQVAASQASTRPVDVVVVPPVPAPVANDAYAKFNDLNNRTQAELQKPVMERDLEGLLKEYQEMALWANVPSSVKQGVAARVDLLQNQIKVQQLAKAANGTDAQAIRQQREALNKQYQDAQKRLAEMESNSPPIAEGMLKTSGALADKYVLINPTTGRVVAYVNPSAEIDLSRLLGQYVGVRGSYTQDATLGIKVIKVRTATLMAAP